MHSRSSRRKQLLQVHRASLAGSFQRTVHPTSTSHEALGTWGFRMEGKRVLTPHPQHTANMQLPCQAIWTTLNPSLNPKIGTPNGRTRNIPSKQQYPVILLLDTGHSLLDYLYKACTPNQGFSPNTSDDLISADKYSTFQSVAKWQRNPGPANN